VVKPNNYLQVVHDTNRYSVPYDYRGRQLVLRAFPFRIELLYLDEIIATHSRCFQREQDILKPWHYLPLLQQRPGAFEYAQPMRRWRQQLPPSYDQLLVKLRESKANGRGVCEFLEILKLNQEYPEKLVKQAVEMALDCGAAHLDGVQLCLRQLLQPQDRPKSLDLSCHPELLSVGTQPVALDQYNQLLAER
jgi:hypothetical protein